MALIFPSHFHGYNKNEIFADYWDAYSAFTFVLDQSRLWKFGELYGKTVAE
jgi:hypothetical protein